MLRIRPELINLMLRISFPPDATHRGINLLPLVPSGLYILNRLMLTLGSIISPTDGRGLPCKAPTFGSMLCIRPMLIIGPRIRWLVEWWDRI